MKTIENQNSLQSHGIKDTVKFGIKASGLAHIFNVLRNQLYSDREMACLREYSCNAVDAHIENKCSSRPIEVKLPTKLDLTLKIRDYGKALSDKEIQDVYAFYGESTKRNTNDQIGQLGLGSKSAFAYGDNFVINSYLDGKLHTYNAFIDPSQIGQISKLGIKDTDEENGIEIVIPIREEDVNSFEQKAIELFAFFPVKPIVTGSTNPNAFEYKKQNVLFEGENWQWFEGGDRYDRGDAIAVMGNIGYPIDESALGLERNENWTAFRSLLCSNLRLNVPIGDLEISASREKLQYTDYTRKNLISMLEKVQTELSNTVSGKFDDCKTLFDAKCLYGSTFDYGSPLYALRETIKGKLLFNGQPVSSDDYNLYNYNDIDLRTFSRRWNGTKFKVEEVQRIDCSCKVVVVENDLGHRRGVMGRVLPLLVTEEKKVYLIQYKDAKEKKKFIEEDGFDVETIKLSSLEQHKLSEFDGYESNSSSSTGEKDKRHSAKCFEFNFNADLRSWHRKNSDWWRIANVDVENESGVYVIIDQFTPMKPSASHLTCTPRELKTYKDSLEQIGIDFPDRVVAYKIKERAKIEGKDGWVNFFDWVKQAISDYVEEGDLWEKWANAEVVSSIKDKEIKPFNSRYSSNFDESMRTLSKIAKQCADQNGLFVTMCNQYSEMTNEKDVKLCASLTALAKDWGIDIKMPKSQKPTHNLVATVNDVLKRYSMLTVLDDYALRDHKSDAVLVRTIANYVNVVDLTVLND